MKRLTERDINGTAMAACCGENCSHNFCCENGGYAECGDMDDIIDRLELHILRKSLEKMEIRKFQEKAKKNVGRCFILNGNYLRIIDIPREQYDLSGHCHFNPYQYPALYLGHGCDNDDIVPFYCDTVFSSILGESKNTRDMSFREISEEEFMVEFDRYVKELRDALLIGNSTMEEQE